MTDTPPRKRFQIHLSTAIVLMVVAGALIWANVRERERHEYLGRFGDSIDWDVGYAARCLSCEYGWPYPAVYFNAYLRPNGAILKGAPNTNNGKPQYFFTDYSNVLVNTAIVLAILFTVWFLCEYLIRRRAARKGA